MSDCGEVTFWNRSTRLAIKSSGMPSRNLADQGRVKLLQCVADVVGLLVLVEQQAQHSSWATFGDNSTNVC